MESIQRDSTAIKGDEALVSRAATKSEDLVQHYLLHEAHNVHQPVGPSLIARKKKRAPRPSRRSSGRIPSMLSGASNQKLRRTQHKAEKKKKKKKEKKSVSSNGSITSTGSSTATASDFSETSYGPQSPMAVVLAAMRDVSPPNSSPRTFPSLQMEGVFTKWTEQHRKSYDKDYIQCIRGRDLETMRKWHEEGRTMQAANNFGESLLHMGCRRGFLDVVKFLIEECGHDLWIRDDTGRTPLHDACWTPNPNPELVDFILAKDPDMLLVSDKRGHTPLDYARKEHWSFWIEHFAKKDMTTLLPKRACFVTNIHNSPMGAQPTSEVAVVENLGLMISQLELDEAPRNRIQRRQSTGARVFHRTDEKNGERRRASAAAAMSSSVVQVLSEVS